VLLHSTVARKGVHPSVYGDAQQMPLSENTLCCPVSPYGVTKLAGEPIDVYGDGAQTRDFTFVADIVEGIVRASSAPGGAVINLGGGQRVTLLEAMETRAQVTGCTPVTRTKPSQPGDARDTRADIALARRYLDFAPRVGLADGLAAEWAWLTDLERSRSSGGNQ
jgi:nucleoside-diphosphate-sugar epimerase